VSRKHDYSFDGSCLEDASLVDQVVNLSRFVYVGMELLMIFMTNIGLVLA
jgi:hypothetical protein